MIGTVLNTIRDRRWARVGLCALLAFVSVWAAFPQIESVYLSVAASEKRKIPIYCVQTDSPKVAISFDAAWGADDTDTLLAILKEYNVHATFFLCGYWIDKYPEEVKRIYEQGHDIGNHSNTHAHGAQLSLSQNQAEIQGVTDKVKNLLGIDINLYRAPYGEYNNTVMSAAESLGYYTIQWDIDSLDWKNYGVQEEVDRVLDHKHLGNGSIILFHNDAKYTPQALPIILAGLKAKGYEVVPVSQLIYKDNFVVDSEGRQRPAA